MKPAAILTSTGRIGVLATQATFQGELFADLVARYGEGVEVLTRACRGGRPGGGGARRSRPPPTCSPPFALPLVAGGADVLVLGCTHYSFLRDALAAQVGPGVAIVDPAAAVARQVARVATKRRDADRGRRHHLP